MGIYIFHFYTTKNKLHGGDRDLTGKYKQQYCLQYVNKPFLFLVILPKLLMTYILTCTTLPQFVLLSEI